MISATALVGTFTRMAKVRPRDRARRRAFRSLMTESPWCMDQVRVDNGILEIQGWAVPPRGRHWAVTFTVNGQPFEDVTYPTERDDIERVFWHVPYARYSGFKCRTKIGGPIDVSQPLTFQFVDKRTGTPFRGDQSWYFNPVSAAHLPLPDGPRMRRVHGSDAAQAFLLEGYCTWRKLDEALRRHVGRPFADFGRVLDWGCGCGRLTRHLQDLPAEIIGIDIDDDNVNWCARHLPRGAFSAIPLHPPTHLASNCADLVIGISIFTHLRAPEQDEWLDELRRLSAPGAILLLTVHSDAAVCREGWGTDVLELWQRVGLIDGLNHDLDGFIADPDYYRNTYHTRQYIQDHWSKYFDIVAIDKSYIGNLHDLVIARAR